MSSTYGRNSAQTSPRSVENIIMDHYSGWTELAKLRHLDTGAVTKTLERLFETDGLIPKVVCSDGGPQFCSEFVHWRQSWNIKPERSSPTVQQLCREGCWPKEDAFQEDTQQRRPRQSIAWLSQRSKGSRWVKPSQVDVGLPPMYPRAHNPSPLSTTEQWNKR